MRKVYLLFTLVFSMLAAEAQYYSDYGLILGVATHRGDINSSQSLFGGSRATPTVGGYYRRSLSSLIAVRGQLQWARLEGDDANADDPGRIARNLSFRTNIIELAAIAEIHFLNIKDFGRTGRYNVFFNVYGMAGVGMSYYNPQGENPESGEWVDLRPLMTEGEKYSTFTPVFPIGLGAYFTFNRKWRLGAEFGFRFTLTDYLDDVSGNYLTRAEYEEGDELTYQMAVKRDVDYMLTRPDLFPGDREYYESRDELGGIRGNPDSKDHYYFGTISVGMMLRGKSNFYRARYQYTRGRGKKKRRSRAKF